MVAIGAGVASVVVSTFAIVAFLGRFVGTFTVSLDTGDVQLALSESSSFKKQSSFLRVDSLPTYQETTYLKLPSDEVLDNEETTYLIGANYKDDQKTVTSLNFFKYTFYIKNVGKKSANYDLTFKITDNKAGEHGVTLDDTMRATVFETDALKNERVRKDTYAKRALTHHMDEKGEADFHEYISIPDYMPGSPGYATMFESANVIATIPVRNFTEGELRRYTIVTWLEGEDPQSNFTQLAPKGARLKLGVEINAYENK